jgi:hypothetical protein
MKQFRGIIRQPFGSTQFSEIEVAVPSDLIRVSEKKSQSINPLQEGFKLITKQISKLNSSLTQLEIIVKNQTEIAQRNQELLLIQQEKLKLLEDFIRSTDKNQNQNVLFEPSDSILYTPLTKICSNDDDEINASTPPMRTQISERVEIVEDEEEEELKDDDDEDTACIPIETTTPKKKRIRNNFRRDLETIKEARVLQFTNLGERKRSKPKRMGKFVS